MTKRRKCEETVSDCPDCDGDGALCEKCGKRKDDCDCEERYLVLCEKCDGTGVIEG